MNATVSPLPVAPDRTPPPLTALERWASGVLGIDDALEHDWFDSRLSHARLPSWESDSVLVALELIGSVDRAAFDHKECRTPVGTTEVAVGPGRTRRCHRHGVHHAVDHGGHGHVVWTGLDPDGVDLYVVGDDDTAREALLARLRDLVVADASCWRNQLIVFDLSSPTCYRHLDVPSVDGLHLDEALATELRRNLVTPVLRFGEASNPVSRRGVLLTGRPGTGKTWALRSVQAQLAGHATVVVTTPAMFASAGGMMALFAMVAATPPCLVVLEDIDLTISDRRHLGRGADALGELLSYLDGPGRVDGAFVAATTNYPEALDAALRERPGRFDRRIEVGDATPEARRVVLAGLAGPLGVDDATIGAVVERTAGWTLAEVNELVQLASLVALDSAEEIDLVAAVDLVHRPGGATDDRSTGGRVGGVGYV